MGPIMIFDFGAERLKPSVTCPQPRGCDGRPGLVTSLLGPTHTCVYAPDASSRAPTDRIFDGQHRARAAARLLASEDFSIEDDAACDNGGVASGVEGGAKSIGHANTQAGRADGTTRLALGGAAATEGGFSDFPLVVEVYPVRSEQEVS